MAKFEQARRTIDRGRRPSSTNDPYYAAVTQSENDIVVANAGPFAGEPPGIGLDRPTSPKFQTRRQVARPRFQPDATEDLP